MPLRSRIADHPLLAFALVTLVWSWTAWLAGSLLADPTPILAVLVGAWGPTVASLVVVASEGGRPAVRDLLGRLVRWRVPARYYLFAVGVVPATLLLAVTGLVLVGGPVPSATVPADLPGRWEYALLPVVFLTNAFLGGPIAEELGWRGVAQPRLAERLGTLPAGAVVGLCWGLWHLPFFVLPGTGIVVGGLPLLAFVALTTCWSILVGWLVTVGRGSVLLAVLFHTSVNTTFGTLVGVGSDTGSVVAVVLTTLLAVAVLVAVRRRVTRVDPAPV
jgi:membrane protease YdiL (CAAX protease family)